MLNINKGGSFKMKPNPGMNRYRSLERLKPNNYFEEDDEEGVIFDENEGFNVSANKRKKKQKSKFVPKAKYVQHFPGGYKIETEVDSGTPVPFQHPPMPPYGTPFYGGMSPYYPMTPYHVPHYGGYGYGYGAYNYYDPYHNGSAYASRLSLF